VKGDADDGQHPTFTLSFVRRLRHFSMTSKYFFMWRKDSVYFMSAKGIITGFLMLPTQGSILLF
jgi:hypothetical protein